MRGGLKDPQTGERRFGTRPVGTVSPGVNATDEVFCADLLDCRHVERL